MKNIVLIIILTFFYSFGFTQSTTYYPNTRIFTGSFQISSTGSFTFKGNVLVNVTTGDTILTIEKARQEFLYKTDTLIKIVTLKQLRDTSLSIRNSSLESFYIKTLTDNISWQSDVRGVRSIGFGDNMELNNFYANGYGDYKPYIYFNSTSGISALGNDSTSLGIGPTNLFTDSRKYPIGIGYASNYHKYLEQYSWVDKSYADSINNLKVSFTDTIRPTGKIATPFLADSIARAAINDSSYTSSNGITKVGNDFQLWGNFAANIDISSNEGKSFYLRTFDHDFYETSVFGDTTRLLLYKGKDNDETSIELKRNKITLRAQANTDICETVLDTIAGLVYADDYSANYTSRSAVDSGFVKKAILSLAPGAVTLTDNILKANNTTHTFEAYATRASAAENLVFFKDGNYPLISGVNIQFLSLNGAFIAGSRNSNYAGNAITGHSPGGYGLYGYTATGRAIYGYSSGVGYGGYFRTDTGAKIVGFDFNGGEKAYIDSNGAFVSDNATNAVKLSSTTAHNNVGLLDIFNQGTYGMYLYNQGTYGLFLSNLAGIALNIAVSGVDRTIINPSVSNSTNSIGYTWGLAHNLVATNSFHTAWEDSTGNKIMTLGNSGILTIDSLTNRLEKSAIADNGTITLATGVAGWGEAMIGDNQEWASFRFSADGTVTLIDNTANVVATDTDEKFCIYDGGSGVIIKNALGSTLKVAINVHYYIP